MHKVLPVVLLAARLASAVTFSFTDIDVSFTGNELSASSTLSTVATCDLPDVCPNGNLTISGMILDGPLTTIGDYNSQAFMEGDLVFAVDGEDPLTAKILFGSLTKWTDDSFFGYAEITNPLWWPRLGTSFLGINIPLSGSLSVSNGSLDVFHTTADLHAYPMYEDPGGNLPEPGTFALTGVTFVGAGIAARMHRKRRFEAYRPLRIASTLQGPPPAIEK